MSQEVLEQLEVTAGAPGGGDHAVTFLNAHGHGLLHTDMQASGKGGLSHVGVDRVGRQDFDHVEVVAQEGGVIGVRGRVGEIGAAAGEAFGIAVADCHDLRVRVVAIAAEVQIGDAAETDNADADHGAKAVFVRRYSRR